MEATARIVGFDGALTEVLDIPRTRARNAMVFLLSKD